MHYTGTTANLHQFPVMTMKLACLHVQYLGQSCATAAITALAWPAELEAEAV